MTTELITVGIRDLQRNASRVVARVKSGETVQVTERGRLVAVVSPPSEADLLRARLISTGELRTGEGDLADWELPAGMSAGVPPLSRVVLELRDEDDR